MIVRNGPHVHDSPLGDLHLDRRLDPGQVALLCDAISRVGWSPRLVCEVELVEGGGLVRGVDIDPDTGELLSPVWTVRRVTYGGAAGKLPEIPAHGV